MRTQNFYKKFVEFSAQNGIPVKNIVDLMIVLGENGPTDNREITTHTGLSKTSINLIQKEFYSLFLPTSNKTDLTDNGKRVFAYLKDLFPGYQKDIIEFSQNSKSIHGKYANSRPPVDRNYDQFLATSESVIKRAQIMNSMFDIKDKKILFLGDDDFTSIEAAIYSPEKITVVDIDKRILSSIRKISDTEKLNIETTEYDVRESMGKDLWNQFDIVFTDPPYSINGFNLFLSRAVEALNPMNKSARIYICFGHSDLAKERFLPIQETINKSGLVILNLFGKFNRYHGAESIGSNSDMYICEATIKTAPLIKGKFKENIYTNEL
jgi:hypothetical protein